MNYYRNNELNDGYVINFIPLTHWLNRSVTDDTFDFDVEQIFQKLTQIATLETGEISRAENKSFAKQILKYSITLIPILIESKRYSIEKIGQLYIGFLPSKFVLQTQFLSELIKSELFETEGSRHVLIGPMCRTIRSLLRMEDLNNGATEPGLIEARHEAVVKILTEIMGVLEKKRIGKEKRLKKKNERIRKLFKHFKTKDKGDRKTFKSNVNEISKHFLEASSFNTE